MGKLHYLMNFKLTISFFFQGKWIKGAFKEVGKKLAPVSKSLNETSLKTSD